MDSARAQVAEDLIFPSTSFSRDEEPVMSVDVSREVVINEMADSAIPPELYKATEETAENEDTAKLTLAYENLYELPRTIVERFSDHIKYLDISHNKITCLDALVHFKHLTSLIADHNPITENCFLPPLPKLELLWLFVISQFPSLNHLDDRKVTDDQRAEAQRLYKRPFFERIVKPGSGGISQLVHSSVTWSGVQNKLTTLLGKDRQSNRNLMI